MIIKLQIVVQTVNIVLTVLKSYILHLLFQVDRNNVPKYSCHISNYTSFVGRRLCAFLAY